MTPRPSPAALVVLIYKVPRNRRVGLLKFLGNAFPVYERPGGIHMSVFESVQERGLFVEIASYDTDRAYRQDQVRVDKDPEMKRILGRWQKFIDGRPQVLLVRNVLVPKKGRQGPQRPKRNAGKRVSN
jgi:hypothetical protein